VLAVEVALELGVITTDHPAIRALAETDGGETLTGPDLAAE
jgi:hypothetical protein